LRRGYSLAALFLLIATVAVLAAMASSVPAWNKIPWGVATPNLLIGFIGGSMIGGTTGIQYERRLRSTLVGMLVGSQAGMIAAALSISNFNPFMAFLQCAVLVMLALLVRLTTTSRPKLPPLPDERAPFSLTTYLAHASRGRLLLASLAACCTLAALISLILGVQASGLSTRRAWMDAGAQLLLVLFSLSLTIYLLVGAPRTAAKGQQTMRTSPWD
jgi:hypothetical protein